MKIWMPNVNEEYHLKHEKNNNRHNHCCSLTKGCFADHKPDRVCSPAERPTEHPRKKVTDDMELVSHIPRFIAMWLSKFLKHPMNSGKVKITGKRQYIFQGDMFPRNSLRQKLMKESFIN